MPRWTPTINARNRYKGKHWRPQQEDEGTQSNLGGVSSNSAWWSSSAGDDQAAKKSQQWSSSGGDDQWGSRGKWEDPKGDGWTGSRKEDWDSKGDGWTGSRNEDWESNANVSWSSRENPQRDFAEISDEACATRHEHVESVGSDTCHKGVEGGDDIAPLEEYAKALPRGDTFCHEHVPRLQWDSEQVTVNGSVQYCAVALLPSRSPLVREGRSDPLPTQDQARSQAAKRALKSIHDCERLDFDAPVHSNVAPQPVGHIVATEHAPVIGSSCDAASNTDTAQQDYCQNVPEDEIHVLPESLRLFRIREFVDSTEQDNSFCFLVEAGKGMCYSWRLKLGEAHYICLQPHEMSEEEKLGVACVEHFLFAYHHTMMENMGLHSVDCPGLLLLTRASLLKGQSGKDIIQFRWDEMQSTSDAASTPEWLPRVLQLWLGFKAVDEHISSCSPVQPLPNPLTLRTVLSSGGGPNQIHGFFEAGDASKEATVEILKILGQLARQVLLTTALVLRNPGADAFQLKRYLTDEVEEGKLSEHVSLVRHVLNVMAPVLERKLDVDTDDETLLIVMDALFGAYFEADGGGFSSVAKLWQWLTNDQRHASECIGHFLFGQDDQCKYKGRTPTYETFQQVEEEGEFVFRVEYVKADSSFKEGCYSYRRAKPGDRAFPQERDDSRGGQWENLSFNQALGTYNPTSRSSNEDVAELPLPNKVCQWLDGKPIASLVNCKSSKTQTTADGKFLQETYDEKRKQYVLRVTYQQGQDLVYIRSLGGGLGYEISPEGQQHPVAYSEKEKTLLSPTFTPQALPKVVVNWLLSSSSLIHLVAERSNPQKNPGDVIIAEHHDEIVFSTGDSGDEWRCRLHQANTGFAYMATLRGKQYQLMWSEQEKYWLLPSGAAVPGTVMTWLKQQVQDKISKPHPGLQYSMTEYMSRPWTMPPQYIKAKLVLDDLSVSELERELNSYTFRCVALLVEALTHASCSSRATPCNDRLAFLGAYVTESFIVSLLAERLSKNGVSVMRKSDIDVRGCGEQNEQLIISTKVDAIAWRKVCCNHLSYACTCVRLSLHENGLKVDSTPLKASIQEFGRLYRLVADREDPWPWLVSHGAPRALGDAFLAVVGAMYLDSNWCKAKDHVRTILIDHINFCAPLVAHQANTKASLRHVKVNDSLPWKSLDACINRAAMFKTLELEALPPPALQPLDEVTDVSEFLRGALGWSDVHIVMDGRQELACGCCPQTAELQLILSAAGILEKPEAVKALLENDVHQAPQDGVVADPAVAANGGDQAVYCDDCEMWLNGPIQWEDHKIGKKHKKNTKKNTTASSRGAVSAKASSVAERTVPSKEPYPQIVTERPAEGEKGGAVAEAQQRGDGDGQHVNDPKWPQQMYMYMPVPVPMPFGPYPPEYPAWEHYASGGGVYGPPPGGWGPPPGGWGGPPHSEMAYGADAWGLQ